ncbi:hypothetical protein JS562_51420 [Agrobacterium sp. S2]|nr:hypothetical protein [Agrobacterium sp. S2]
MANTSPTIPSMMVGGDGAGEVPRHGNRGLEGRPASSAEVAERRLVVLDDAGRDGVT